MPYQQHKQTIKLDEQYMLGTAEEVKTNPKETFYYRRLHMNTVVLAD